MKKKLDEFLAKILEMPPAYFFVGLGVVCVLLFAPSWFSSESDSNRTGSTNSKTPSFDDLPQPVSQLVDLFGKLSESAGDEFKVGNSLQASIDKLEKLIIAAMAGRPSVERRQVSPGFTATGIDRDSFQPRFADNQIVVQRWQISDSRPVFDGTQSFDQLISNVLKPWTKSQNFRIEMKVYSRNLLGSFVNARLVVDAFGTNLENHGIQATSIWNTTWKINEQELTLESVAVEAQEEITASFNQGQLLLDCTESIFQHCDTLKDQLIYGLDQWSHQIPNIDIIGNQGVAVGDIDQDGLDDLYICQPHGLPNCLLIQNPDGTVDDVSKISKVDILDQSHAALIIDIDNDRDQDLLVSTDENLVLMSNKGNGEFQLEHTLPIGRHAHSISAGDFDQDGDLDLFLCKSQDVNRQSDLFMFPRQFDTPDDGGRNVLLRNEEGWIFHDVTEQCGITTRNNFFTHSAIWHDYDSDGDLDLYVTNEFTTDQLFENQDGWFSEVSEQVGLTGAARHRSVSIGEFNQDGHLDFFVATGAPLSALRTLRGLSNSSANHQLANQASDLLLGESQMWLTGAQGKKFFPFFLRSPIFSSETAYSSATADLNNDGLDDVIVTNGLLTRFGTEEVDELFYSNVFSKPAANSTSPVNDPDPIETGIPTTIDNTSTNSNDSGDPDLSLRIERRAHEVSDLVREGYSFGAHQRNRCYLGIGRWGFANFSALSGVDLPDDARAVATTDWDCDGDTDIVMTCRGGPQIRILCNQLDSKNGHVHFDLVGTESNADAIGARVEVYLTGQNIPLVKSLHAGSGNLSQSTKRLMFGLGQSQTIERVDVVWPTGKTQSYDEISPNARYEIIEGDPKIAEKTNERFQLAIGPSHLHGTRSLPSVAGSSKFYPRPSIPQLQFQTEPGKWFTLEPVNQRPVLAVFWERNSDSENLIQVISDASSRLNSKIVDCVAVFTDSRTGDASRQLEYAKEVTERCKFPFPSGVASESTRDKLRYLAGDWFNHQQLPNLPFAVLLDGQGRACGFYSKEKLAIDGILSDIDLTSQPEGIYRDATAPRGGRWTARYRYAKLNRLRNRLKEVGYQADAELLFEKSQDQRAFEICQKAIEFDSLGDSTNARAYFEKSIEMDPTCVAAYIAEGNLLRRLAKEEVGINSEVQVKMQQAAAADFENAMRLDPSNTEAIIGRANVAIDQNRLNEALDQLMEYIQADPTKYEVHAIIGRLLFYQEKYDEAATFLMTAFENRPSLPFVAGDLGFLYLKVGQYDQAQKFLNLAHRLQPSDNNMLRLLAEAEFFNGRFDKAVTLFQRVTKLEPYRRRSKSALAWLLATCPYENYRNGEEAMKLIKPMFDLFGDSSPSTLEIYAACFAENGEFDKALRFQQGALDLIIENQTNETYTDEQQHGLRIRLELYRRKRPYRTADIHQIPIESPGKK